MPSELDPAFYSYMPPRRETPTEGMKRIELEMQDRPNTNPGRITTGAGRTMEGYNASIGAQGPVGGGVIVAADPITGQPVMVGGKAQVGPLGYQYNKPAFKGAPASQQISVGGQPFDADTYFGVTAQHSPGQGRTYGANVSQSGEDGGWSAYGGYNPTNRSANVGGSYTANFSDGGRALVGHTTAAGEPVSLEEHKGQIRHRQDSGNSRMAADYGYIDNSRKDHDGMKTDAFVGPHRDSKRVFVVNQQHPRTGKFNEHKVLLGYKDRAHALRDYVHSFSDGLGHKRIQSVVEMGTHELKDWLQKPHTAPLRKAKGGPVHMEGGGDLPPRPLTIRRGVTPQSLAAQMTPLEEQAINPDDFQLPEPVQAAAKNYMGNVADAFRESSEYARQGLENTVSDKGPGYNVIGPAQYMLGSLGAVSAPVTGAFKSAGQAATELSGNPEIGERLETVLGLLPFGGGAAKGAVRATTKAARAAEEEGIRYVTQQDGPFYRVRHSGADELGATDRGVKEIARDDSGVAPVDAGGSGSVRDGVPKQLSDEAINALLKSPEDNRLLAKAMEHTGSDFQPVNMPESSLAKQSAIGRAFELAAEGSPEYKATVFEAYKRDMPEVVKEAGAKNYDELMAASYKQMAKETKEQFDSLPLSYSFHKNGEGNYASSAEMAKDVHGNGHLYVYQGGDPHDSLHNVDPRTGLNENEMFRAVHDAYGHAVHGNQFGPKGEEIAWGLHQQMYSPLAKLAMTAETRGQNSFVNYTPINAKLKEYLNELEEARIEARRNRNPEKMAKIAELKKETNDRFQYAPQKSVLLPPEFVSTEYTGGMPAYLDAVNKPTPGTTIAADLTHFSPEAGLTELDPSRYGTGIPGAERSRLIKRTGETVPGSVRDRTYFYTSDPDKVVPEAGLGQHRYKARSENLYDIYADPKDFKTLARESTRQPWDKDMNPGTVDPTQFANALDRLIKEHGYEGMMNPNAAFPMATVFKPKAVTAFADGGPVDLPDQIRNVTHDIARIAHKDKLDQRHLAYLLKVASGMYMPADRAMQYAQQIMIGDVDGLIQRFRAYRGSIVTFARLNQMMGGKHKFMGSDQMGKHMQRMKGLDSLNRTKDAVEGAMGSDVVKSRPVMAKALKKISKRI
jgi:hypothetical protein